MSASTPAEKATESVQVYVTPSQRAEIKAAVDAANQALGGSFYSESTWGRSVLLKAARELVAKAVAAVPA